MKKTVLILLALLFLCAFASAEQLPDGTTYGAYIVRYDEAAMSEWRTVQYPDYGGLIFTAYRDDAEITVSVEEKGSYASAMEYLNKTTSNVSLYARVSGVYGPDPWNDPFGSGDGYSTRYTYLYSSASEKDEAYYVSKYACPITDEYYLIIAINYWGANAQTRLSEFEYTFLPSFALTQVSISTKYLAYLRGAEASGGRVALSLDFCTVEYDSDIFTAYVVNDDASAHAYPLSAEAMLWMPSNVNLISGAERTSATIENVQSAIADYYRKNNADAIYQVLLNGDNEIVWMLHYDAF